MDEWVLEIEERGRARSAELAPGLTRVGGAGCEIALEQGGADQLHLWDAPAKLVFVGKGERPRVGGRSVDELALVGGERIEWLGATLRLQRRLRPAVLSELPPPLEGSGSPAWAQVRAGLLVELGLADRAATKRWQEAVLRGEFDAAACANDLLLGAHVEPSDPRLIERSTRLLRDLLMAPYQRGLRGAARSARGAARNTFAFVVVQSAVLLTLALLILILLVVLRLRWGWSVDGFLDGLIEWLPA